MRILLEPSSVQMLYIRLTTLPLLAAAPLNNNRTSNWRQYRPDVFIVLPPSIHLPPVYEVVVMYWQLTWPCHHPSLFTVTHIGFVRILGPGDNFIPLRYDNGDPGQIFILFTCEIAKLIARCYSSRLCRMMQDSLSYAVYD